MNNDPFMNNILDIQHDLECLWSVFDPSKYEINITNYSRAIGYATAAVEKMISLLANEHGFEYEDGQIRNKEIYPYSDKRIIRPFSLVLEGYFTDIPQEIIAYIQEISLYKDTFNERIEISYEEAVVFAGTFDCFVSWFLVNANTLESIYKPEFEKVKGRFRSFKNVLSLHYRSQDNTYSDLEIVSNIPQATKVVENGDNKEQFEEKVLSSLAFLTPLMVQMAEDMSQVKTSVNQIQEKLEILTKQIESYQSLLEKQIDRAISEDEINRILSAYADECTQRIVNNVNGVIASQAYLAEKNKLILSIGADNWSKLDSSSQDFLITAKLSYNSLIKMQDIIDYSGVCLLVTKAIEVEMSNRFYRDYISFLKVRYPGKENYTQYPSPLLKYQKPIREKDFTLGTVAYVLCYINDPESSPEQNNNNKSKLLEFVSERLMQGKDEQTITEHIQTIAQSVETIRKDYRNPSAHTNRLQRINAEQCFNLVLDVEKLLKTIMELLDY